VFQVNNARNRFEWSEQGLISFADYRGPTDRLLITHVEAPVALRGTGAAGRLMQALADHARGSELKLVPVCSYAVAWFRRHKDQADVLA
jgi:predicted GNAT family acetyltransferase